MITIVPGPIPTRQKLMEAGMRLFASRGFRATSVGDIEAAVGLQPRRGALYKHFPSKQALLEAAVKADLERAALGSTQLAQFESVSAVHVDRETLRTLLLPLGRWFLDEMDRLESLTRVMEHDGARVPKLIAKLKTDMVDLSYRSVEALLTAVVPQLPDKEVISVLLLGPLVAIRRTEWTYGTPPLDLSDERVLSVWVEMCLDVIGI